MTSGFVDDLVLHLKSGYPIIFLITLEEQRALFLLKEATKLSGRSLVKPRTKGQTRSLEEQLSDENSCDAVLLLDDVHRQLDNAQVVRLLADVADRSFSKNKTIVVLSPWVQIPPELERISAVLELSLPSALELRKVLNDVCGKVGVLLVEEDIQSMVRVGQGLTLDEATRAFDKALLGWPEEAEKARNSVEKDKRRALHRSSVLEHVDTPTDMNDVGGLNLLKSWLNSRKNAFSDEARQYGLPAPRGLLLMGIQGCGKSLCAKAVAGFWKLPLVRLDLSAVFGQKSPEEALRGALNIAEAMAPVVLWIDEIEKGFDSEGQGSSSRLLGGMVTWLQEKKKEVFVVATANKVEKLPPELPRKGRFDEIFFVDLPDTSERTSIIKLHMKKRGLDLKLFDVSNLVKKTDKYTGSELEQLVISAMYLSFSQNEQTDDKDFLRVIQDTVTLYDTFEPEIKRLREWARKRARSASADRKKIDYFSDTSSKLKA